MKRSDIDRVKAQAAELLHRIDVMERCAGWERYSQHGDQATGDPHPDDHFKYGHYTASVKRASMDLTRSLVEIRR